MADHPHSDPIGDAYQRIAEMLNPSNRPRVERIATDRAHWVAAEIKARELIRDGELDKAADLLAEVGGMFRSHARIEVDHILNGMLADRRARAA